MQYLDRRKEAGGALGELVPVQVRTLAAPFQQFQPAPTHLVEEPPQARVVAGDGIIVQMSCCEFSTV